ncbi:ras-related GTP-binding protein D-like isoform X1 [Pseudoliparis swirei]|uniref:ras-related GTP-binding protein D-like isoform X1 n=1 Tax=Pseudoliparis swirei TaxID=2059687 RepID=UPI0024BD868F|nr:ras-related GTP-binding protein D-like isoform X1 [Pseudoliparis swirei]
MASERDAGEQDCAAEGYYDDDEDDLEAFSDAEPGCEDGVLGFSDPLNGEVKPRILLMGLRRRSPPSRRWFSIRCRPTRPCSWRAPTRSAERTCPAAPSSASRSGTSPARSTSSTPPSTTR